MSPLCLRYVRWIDTSKASGPNSWKVICVLEELQLPYEIHSFKFDDVKKPPFIDVNPNGRVPGKPNLSPP